MKKETKNTKSPKQIVVVGDNIEVLKQYPDNYFDSVATDAPYGLGKEPNALELLQAWTSQGYLEIKGKGFMGKEWDAFVPQPIFWKEVFRVLKHGGHVVCFFGTRTYDWGVVAMRLAGFEIRDQITWLYGCYSEDTEVLTKRGWLNYKELVDSDEIMQWQNETNELSWVVPLDKYEYDIDDEMVLLENRNTSQLVTKNHTVYAKIRRHCRNPKAIKFETMPAIDLKKSWIIDLPLAGNLQGTIDEPNAYLLGWWLTDAWIHNDKKACMFSQSKPVTLLKLRNTLENSDCKYSEYIKKSKKETHNDEHTFYVVGKVADFLIQSYEQREMTWDLLNFDYQSRYNLVEGLLDGDGSRRRDELSYGEVFWSKKRERLDIFQALCVSLNRRCHIDYKKGCVYLNNERNTTQIQHIHRKPLQKYKGKVWCLKTETGAFVVRRNGKAFISGNSGFPKSMDISKQIDKMQGNEREVIGVKKHSRKGVKIAEERTEIGAGAFGAERTSEVTIPSSEEAKQWEGWGTALKPAQECIVLARKPIEKGLNVTQNILKWGVGGLNIDVSRIATSEQIMNHSRGSESAVSKGKYGDSKEQESHQTEGQKNGRFPTNVIFSHHPECECIGYKKVKGSNCNPESIGKGREGDHSNGIYGAKSSKVTVSHTDTEGMELVEDWKCHDDCPIKILDEQSGISKSSDTKRTRNTIGSFGMPNDETREYSDEGGSSRFFYVAKASKSERSFGLEGANFHPTVKPIKLMQYLVRLITPEGGKVLEPFAGSGTTGCACKIDGFECVLIDITPEYAPIIQGRIDAFVEEKEIIDNCKIFDSVKDIVPNQLNLFE